MQCIPLPSLIIFPSVALAAVSPVPTIIFPSIILQSRMADFASAFTTGPEVVAASAAPGGVVAGVWIRLGSKSRGRDQRGQEREGF